MFNKLMQLAPGLEERLMEKPEEEVALMAELVCSIHITLAIGIEIKDLDADSERHRQCAIRRHEDSQRRCTRLDHTK